MYNRNKEIDDYLNSQNYEYHKAYIEQNPKLLQYIKDTGYQHPSMMQSSPVSSPVTSNLGIGSSGPNKPSYLHLDPTEYSGTPQTMNQFYARKFPESRPGMPNFIIQGDPTLQGIDPAQASSYYGADPMLTASEQAVKESIAEAGAKEAGKSALESPEGLTGPQSFFANMALSAIPTRDRNKVNTPFGDQGSVPGSLKGAGKGALLGGTIGSAFGPPGATIGAIGGGIIGGVTGTQGTFDSTSPRQVIRRAYSRPRSGGLLTPKGLYG